MSANSPFVIASAPRLVLPGGFAVLKEVFSQAELAAARDGLRGLRQGHGNLTPSFPWPQPRANRAKSYKFPGSAHHSAELAALAQSRRLARRIAITTGASSVRFWFDQVLEEAPAPRDRAVNYHWHTERSRWKTCQAPLMVTAWIPLTDVSLEMGPLTVVRRSSRHRWLDLPTGYEPQPDELFAQELQAGSALLFCWHTVHGNPPNFGDRPREVLAAHFALNELAYQAAGKFSHLNEKAVRSVEGRPDFSDERVCPLVFGAS
ncbi:MAG: phytanoyl-CoA dioxygenase family protein [Verrucomicrobiota bacterium JB023]|nr:phytanoyl-CoA dioxygenase family protein [Verrucomicrobiota bacterium JB023]